MKYARIIDGVAIEIFVPQEGFTIAESFHPDVAALFSEVPENVTVKSTKHIDGTWEIYVEPIIETPQPSEGEQQIPPDVAE